MAELEYKIRKSTSVPTLPVEAGTMFLVAPPANPNYIEIYVANNAGSALKRLPTDADITNKINTALASIERFTSVSTIAERDALDTTTVKRVFVINATGDATVNSGSASYAYDDGNSAWIKTSESESLDIVLSWANLQNKPSSTVAAIDLAVSQSHTHANKTQLDSLGDSGGKLTYNGTLVTTTINDAW